ncbi:MAG: nucleotidyltransferase family protein [Chloroflexota bacterium]
MNSLHSPTRAIILAAGRGQRLSPATDTTPKPLLPVDGRPTLDYVLQALAAAEVKQVCLVTHYLAEQVEGYVGDGQRWGMEATYRRQGTAAGTAHALQAAAGFLTEPTVVLAADYALPLAYVANLKVTYLAAGQPDGITIALGRLTEADLTRRSSVELGGDLRIHRIVEKPPLGAAPSPYCAYLVYIVPADIGDYLPQVRLSSRGEYELPDAINLMIADGYPAVGCLQPPPPEW